MNQELALRVALIAEVVLIFPLMAYHRIKARFGDPCRAYLRQTGRFLPRITAR